jgi:hypothetical protein
VEGVRSKRHHDDDGATDIKFSQFTLWDSAWLTLLKSLQGVQQYLTPLVAGKNLCFEKTGAGLRRPPLPCFYRGVTKMSTENMSSFWEKTVATSPP